MLPYVEKFSGVIAMFIAWFFVVGPALKYGIKIKSQTITTSTYHKNTGKVIGYSLVIGALFQAGFIFYLKRKYGLDLISFGSLLYLSTNLVTILVALFTEKRNKRIHATLVTYYFIFCPLSMFFVGLSFQSIYPYFYLISVAAPIVYFAGQLVFLTKFKKGNALMQLWAFLVLSIWTLYLTFS